MLISMKFYLLVIGLDARGDVRLNEMDEIYQNSIIFGNHTVSGVVHRGPVSSSRTGHHACCPCVRAKSIATRAYPQQPEPKPRGSATMPISMNTTRSSP